MCAGSRKEGRVSAALSWATLLTKESSRRRMRRWGYRQLMLASWAGTTRISKSRTVMMTCSGRRYRHNISQVGNARSSQIDKSQDGKRGTGEVDEPRLVLRIEPIRIMEMCLACVASVLRNADLRVGTMLRTGIADALKSHTAN